MGQSSSRVQMNTHHSSSNFNCFIFHQILTALVLWSYFISITHGQNRLSGFSYRVPQSDLNYILPSPDASPERRACYDLYGRAQRCVPAFVNAAHGRPAEATNTCETSEYCIQTPKTGRYTQSSPQVSCYFCRPGEHDVSKITDYHSDNTTNTWWQSSTMADISFELMQGINITLHLGKAYDVTYIRLVFQSPRPESFAIFKREVKDGPWKPFQYYSANCQETFKVPHTPSGESDAVLCSQDFSDISPLSGGNVVFHTFEGRPSQYEMDPRIQEFVTATDIKINLIRPNTFGDEIFKDMTVLKRYFYAISDLSVGGRCKCNGHASECYSVDSTSERCKCEHNTNGTDCERCNDLYNDAPWGVANAYDAHECRACNCNNRADRCEFDMDLYEKTGHGGRCIDCRGNFDGPNCDRCKDGFFEDLSRQCAPCNCDKTGSLSTRCSADGQCVCKPGVDGKRCDRCAANHYEFSANGCKPCECLVAGSYNNTPTCDTYTGECSCKKNVEGRRCDRCKPGHFDLQATNEFGCLTCFCYGHSSICHSAGGYSKYQIESNFYRDAEKWSVRAMSGSPVDIIHNPSDHTIGAKSPNAADLTYFVAPTRYLGDQKFSYNQFLKFTYRSSSDSALPLGDEIVLEGAGIRVVQSIIGQQNPRPSTQLRTYRFRLHEDPKFGWSPILTPKDFIAILANLTAIKIRGNYPMGGTGYIDEVKLESAQSVNGNIPATWIERCECPQGYEGQYCDMCKSGYRHDPPGGGPFSVCLPCQCNGYSDFCDAYTGNCQCQNNTGGPNCEICARGYYGNPLAGTGCTQCPCPNGGPCVLLADDTIACLECPLGSGGARCEHCIDGYYGAPLDGKTCRKCDCKGNIDDNAVGNCDSKTGTCLKCIYNTGGTSCDRCLPGFFGDALAIPKGDCRDCDCHQFGSIKPNRTEIVLGTIFDSLDDDDVRDFQPKHQCDDRSGQCICKQNVMGRRCDRCVEGFWNIQNPEGCIPCKCDVIGSMNHTCDEVTGQCHCRTGIEGLKCGQCKPLHYGFSEKGCQRCDCDPIGSRSPQCTSKGQCECLPNVEGRRCDRCRENKFNREAGCIDCPPCYNLIQDAVNDQRARLNNLRYLLTEIETSPQGIEDSDLVKELEVMNGKIRDTQEVAKRVLKVTQSYGEDLRNFQNNLGRVRDTINQTTQRMKGYEGDLNEAYRNISQIEVIIDGAQNVYRDALREVDVNGRAAIQTARERFQKYGQSSEQMSKIARQAIDLTGKLRNDTVKIENLEKEIEEDMVKLSELRIDSDDLYKLNTKEIQRMLDQIDNTKELIARQELLSDRAYKMAEKVQANAIGLFTEAKRITLPDIDAAELKSKARELGTEAKKISAEAKKLTEQRKAILNGTEIGLKELKALWENSSAKREENERLKAQVQAALDSAKNSSISADETLRKATEILSTLEKSDDSLKQRQEAAQQAASRIPELTEIINEAYGKSEQIHQVLKKANDEAIEANITAIKSRGRAEDAVEDAKKVRDLITGSKEKAQKLRQDYDSLNQTVSDFGQQLATYEAQMENDRKFANQVSEETNQAKSKAIEAKEQAKKAKEELQAIMDELRGLVSFDIKAMNDLDLQITSVEERLRNTDISNRTQALKEARDASKNLNLDYSHQIETLRLEVANIQQISQSIPTECLRRLFLEP